MYIVFIINFHWNGGNGKVENYLSGSGSLERSALGGSLVLRLRGAFFLDPRSEPGVLEK